ncbi:MAG TPA: beta-ketoacyl synthase N-terminal-like domain-containing protein, partial [Gemmata sp.]|nr:beta-ketoacyl synthase N-terminal-like domain-containing protein [Gemmata sp.]
ESLRELWGDSGWSPGQCAIGSVKSTVGHLLTGAGAAAVAKVLQAIKAGGLPPQANFTTAATGLRYEDGPFRVLTRPEMWRRRPGRTPRRAAVSGFGFGGVNAHLLLEEWSPPLAKQAVSVSPSPSRNLPPPAIAVVGLAAHFGTWDDTRKFQEHVLAGDAATAIPKKNGWGLAPRSSAPGFGIEELRLPIDRFRIPPKELEETLPQQLLMLKVAAAALDDSGLAARTDDPTTGAFIGLGLDPNTMNYNLRWSALAQESGIGSPESALRKRSLASSVSTPDSRLLTPDSSSPPLSANRVMGALGSIAASRIARAFHFGGPFHTVCSEEASSARAIELGVRALQLGELDCALVGGVDLASDPRIVIPGDVKLPGEGAAAFVLKLLADAERDGDRVYAIIRGVGAADNPDAAMTRASADAGADFANAVTFDATPDVGETGAAAAAASLAKGCIALWQQILPGKPPRYWLHDRVEGPRRASITAAGADGSHLAILLEEQAKAAEDLTPIAARSQPLGAREEAVFVAEGNGPSELIGKLQRLTAFAGEHK